MVKRKQYLAFEGCGTLGVCYAGVLRALHDSGIWNFDGYAGCSSGSIQAFILALGADIDFVEKEIMEFDFNSLKDDSRGFIRDLYRLFRYYGFYKGDALTDKLKHLCHYFTGFDDITFKELYNTTGKDLVIVGVNLSKRRIEYFNKDTTPDMSCITAVKISTNVPIVFKSVVHNGDVYTDGGLLDIFPVHVFDKLSNNKMISGLEVSESDYDTNYNLSSDSDPDSTSNSDSDVDRSENRSEKESVKNKRKTHRLYKLPKYPIRYIRTIGIKASTSKEIRGEIEPITNIISYLTALVDTLQSHAHKTLEKEIDKNRTIEIDCQNYSSLDFKLTNEDKNTLYYQGVNAANEFIDRNIKKIRKHGSKLII